MTASRLVACAVALLVVSGCDRRSPPADVAPTAAASTPAPVASTAGTVAKPSASASAAPSAAAMPTAWAGHYDAKVGEVNPPKAAREKTWASDPGAVAVGKGTIALTITTRGVVTGSMSGPLGELIVSGEADEKEVRANVAPKEASSAHAMTGVLSLTKQGDELRGALRASDRDAKLVREAAVELSSK